MDILYLLASVNERWGGGGGGVLECGTSLEGPAMLHLLHYCLPAPPLLSVPDKCCHHHLQPVRCTLASLPPVSPVLARLPPLSPDQPLASLLQSPGSVPLVTADCMFFFTNCSAHRVSMYTLHWSLSIAKGFIEKMTQLAIEPPNGRHPLKSSNSEWT